MEAAGFAVDRTQEPACGSASFATLHPSLPVRIDFDAYQDRIQFTVVFGSVCFQKKFGYQELMYCPSDADIVIPIVLRAMFCEAGNQFAEAYYKTLNLNKEQK